MRKLFPELPREGARAQGASWGEEQAGSGLGTHAPHRPGRSLNFSGETLDSGALGLEPGSWRLRGSGQLVGGVQ